MYLPNRQKANYKVSTSKRKKQNEQVQTKGNTATCASYLFTRLFIYFQFNK
jgi:hypothetical protein